MSTNEIDALLDAVPDEARRADARAAVEILRDATGTEPTLWGSIVGFGHRPYTTADGKEHDWFAAGLAPRKAALVLYGLIDHPASEALLTDLGPHTTGKGCLYLKRLDDVDHAVLRQLVARALEV